MNKRKIFHVYDHLAVIGGAEKVGFFLKKRIPDIQFIVGGINSRCYNNSEIKDVFAEISYIDHPLKRLLRQIRYFWGSPKCLRNKDIGIYSGAYAPMSVHSSVKLKVHYCHTIPRYAYDLYQYNYQKRSFLGRFFFHLLVLIVRRLYEESLHKMDLHLVNSKNTQDRLKKFTGIDSFILYPPVEISNFKFISQEDFYLSLGRLEPLKRVSSVVRAFLRMPDKKLVVISGGSEFEQLVKLVNGAPNISLLGWVGEQEMANLIGRCIATIYVPVDEDFGMSPVESMAAGKPVIGVNDGGLKETIIPGVTGYLCAPDLPEEELIEAVYFLNSDRALQMRPACEQQAQKFSADSFIEQLDNFFVKTVGRDAS